MFDNKNLKPGETVNLLRNDKAVSGKILERVRAKTKPRMGNARFDEMRTKKEVSYIIEVNRVKIWAELDAILGYEAASKPAKKMGAAKTSTHPKAKNMTAKTEPQVLPAPFKMIFAGLMEFQRKQAEKKENSCKQK